MREHMHMVLKTPCEGKASWVVRGGRRGIRTPDHLLKRQLLYQLSYAPEIQKH